MTKILIGTPCYGGMITEGYMISIINLMSRLREMDIPVAIKTIGNESLITRARNSIVAEFLVHPEEQHYKLPRFLLHQHLIYVSLLE